MLFDDIHTFLILTFDFGHSYYNLIVNTIKSNSFTLRMILQDNAAVITLLPLILYICIGEVMTHNQILKKH